MKVEGVQWDVCTKMVSTQTTYLPNHWFVVMRGEPDICVDIFHFCCLAHLREWADKQLDVKEMGKLAKEKKSESNA